MYLYIANCFFRKGKVNKVQLYISYDIGIKILWEWMTQSRSSMYAKLPKTDMRDDETRDKLEPIQAIAHVYCSCSYNNK